MKTPFLVLALLIAGSSLIAQPKQGRPDNENRPDMQKPEDRLQLTPEQQTKMETLRVELHKTTQPIENQLGEKEAALHSLTTVDNPDRKKVESTVAEIGKLENSLMLARVNHQLDVRAMLDDNQKILFDDRHDKMARGEHGGMHQKH